MIAARIMAGVTAALRGMANVGEHVGFSGPQPLSQATQARFVHFSEAAKGFGGTPLLVSVGPANVEAVFIDNALTPVAPLAAALCARPPLPADLSANQTMLFIRAAMEKLEWEIPHHDGPMRLSPDSRRLLAAHCGDIAAGLTALLSIPTIEPEPIDEA